MLLEGPEPLEGVARDGLQNFLTTFNRSVTRPTRDEAVRLSHLLERCDDQMPPETVDRIRFLMA